MKKHKSTQDIEEVNIISPASDFNLEIAAREKAKKLIQKFHPLTKSNDKMALEIYGDSICCLIILADEMIEELNELPKIPYNEKRLEFWKILKIEIGKL